MTAVEVERLTKRFDSVTAVDDIDLRVEPGELFFLLGPSGCGKTTLLRMIAGFVEPTAGRIRVDDQDVTTLPPSRRLMAMVFQSYALWPHMTVRDNIAYGLKIKKVDKAQRTARVDEALAAVQLDAVADRRPNALSGGQQQRVALARALVVRPRVLLLDEPLSNLDARLRQEMRSEIRRICKEAGLTGLYVTHDQDEALSMADRIALLKDGKVVQCAPPTELYSRPTTRFAAKFLGDTNLIPGTITGTSDGGVVVQTSFGSLHAATWTGSTPPSGKVMCSIRPEAVVPHKGEGANVLQLSSTGSVFLGERVRVMLEMGKQARPDADSKTAEGGPTSAPLQASIARPLAEMLKDGPNSFAIDPQEIVVLTD